MQSSELVVAVFTFVLLLFSLSVHESAHAWMASRLGDQTARMLGRVSLNPIDHIDPIGTLLLPALMIFGPLFGFGYFGRFLFGWAKPVPIISRNFRNFKRDDMLVSLAGPASNLLLAFIAFLGLAAVLLSESHLPEGASPSTAQQSLETLCDLAFRLNLTLCIFNLLPIPPLDGSHVLRNVLPYGAVRVFDSITGPLSYVLLLVVGVAVLRIVMTPLLSLAYGILAHI
ncbi:MAG TPA: site-2 protease family protein [Terracidiphilus sp.]